jgi:hypothetical protein
MIQDRYGRIIKTRGPDLTDDHQALLNENYINRFKNIAQSSVGVGALTGAGSPHAQDIQDAKMWIQNNQNDPRVSQVKQKIIQLGGTP